MELREKILAKARELMFHNGISITMDSIAKACGISKRTLYEQIPDKHALVSMIIDFHSEDDEAEIQSILENSTNTLDALLKIYMHMRERFKGEHVRMVNDLQKLYPDLEDKFLERHRMQNKKFADFLYEGKKEGLYRDDVDFNVAVYLLMLQIKNVAEEEQSSLMPYTKQDLYDMAFITSLRGIASPKGMALIDNMTKENGILEVKE